MSAYCSAFLQKENYTCPRVWYCSSFHFGGVELQYQTTHEQVWQFLEKSSHFFLILYNPFKKCGYPLLFCPEMLSHKLYY